MSTRPYSNERLRAFLGTLWQGNPDYRFVFGAIEQAEERGIQVLLDFVAEPDNVSPYGYNENDVWDYVSAMDWSKTAFREKSLQCFVSSIFEAEIFKLRRFALGCLIHILGHYPDASLQTSLLDLLQDNNPDMQREAILFFQALRIRQALPKLLGFLDSNNISLLQTSIGALAYIAPDSTDVRERVLPFLLHENILVQKEAISFFGKLAEPKAVPYLLRLLEASDYSLAKASIIALRAIAPDNADVRGHIRQCLFAEGISIQQEAIRFIREVKDREAIPHLTLLLRDDALGIVESSQRALLAIGTEDALFALSEWKKQ